MREREIVTQTYHFLIIGGKNDDHLFLNVALNEVFPSVYSSSVFSVEEFTKYIQKDREHLDLILLDLRDKYALNFIYMLRKVPEFLDVPIILVSQSDNARKAARMIKDGIKDFLVMPNDLHHIIENVRMIKKKWVG